MFAYPQSEQVRFHTPIMFETCKRVGQFACPKLGRESHRETNRRRVSRRMSIQTHDYTYDRQSRQNETGQCRGFMNNIWQRRIKTRRRGSNHRMSGMDTSLLRA